MKQPDLSDREIRILRQRYSSASPMTLEEVAQTEGVVRERINQIENKAIKKITGKFKNELVRDLLRDAILSAIK